MEKTSRPEDDHTSLTSFNFIPEGDEEGLISKIFSKFKSAVTAPPPQQQQHRQQQQQSVSPSSSANNVLIGLKDSAVVDVSNKEETTTTVTKIPITINAPSTPSPSVSKSNTPSSQKHIHIDEDQNQQQIPSMIPLTKTSSIDSDTQSIMTTFSVSNTNSLSRILNRLRGSEQVDSNKEFWIPDEQCKECNNCKSPFNLFRRKHHCRTCGRIFCSKCLTNNIHTSHSLRVCNDCYIKYVAGYHADDTISLHDGYSYSSVVVDSTLSSSLIPQPSQQKSILIPTSGDDDSSDEEIEFERPTNSFDLQRSGNLELHISQSTSSHHTQSDTDLGLKKLLTNTLLRGPPRSRTSTMNSLGIDTSLATLENVRQQHVNSPMPFRRNSLVVNNGDLHPNNVTAAPGNHNHHHGHGSHTPTHQHQADYYDGEDDDIRRWDKNPSNLLNFLGGHSERPNSGIFNAEDLDSPTIAAATPVLSTSTGTINKWFMRTSGDRSSNLIRRRLSLTDNVSSTSTTTATLMSPNLNSGSSSSSGGRHVRVRTKSLMRNTPITSVTDDNGYESPNSNQRHSLPQQLTPSSSTPIMTNRSMTPDLDQLRTQIMSVSATANTQTTHHQWDTSFIYLMRNIIVHLLEESKLPRADWEEVMMKLLLKTADDVQPHLRLRDTFNMNHYVKVKKIPGGLPKDSFSVSGVMFSKCVAHKGMMRKVKNPSILILNFDVDGFTSVPTADGTPRSEYLKFDRLLAWERDHMEALVTEIIGLKPHIVLFASNVPRTIIDCLNKAKIIVVYNVKKQKLDAIARCTDATVFNYKNELWNAKTISPGKCGVFEPLTVLHEYIPNRRKTYLMFHDCPKERGNCIVLRGGDLATLGAVKFIMNFMVKVVNNINLEAQLRKDFIELRRWNQSIYDEDGVSAHMDEDTAVLGKSGDGGGRSTAVSSYHAEGALDAAHVDAQSVLSVAESQITVNTIDVAAAKRKSQQQLQQATITVEDDDICLTAVNAVLKQYQTAILSISPGVTLPVPHILLKLREALKKLIGIIREKLGANITGNILATDNSVYHSLPTSPSLDEKQPMNKQSTPIPPIPTDLGYMQDYLKAFDTYLEHDLEYRHYQDLYLQCWMVYNRYIGGVCQYLSPVYHQQMLVRRTTTPAEDHTIPCEKAVLDPYEYYNPIADCTLVQYILRTVKDAYTKCSSKMCGNLLIFHDRTYSHGNAQVKVQVFLEDDNGDEEIIEESIDIGRDEYLRKIPIFMSTYCNICKVQHHWKPMSELLQRYSFGKFLELLFYQSDPIPLFDESDQTRNYFTEDTNMGCPHGFYRDHTISFRIQNLSVNFTHATVQVLEVVPPPLHLRFSSKQQMAIKDASLDSARSMIAKFFDSVTERNKAFSYDIVQPNMVETCKEYLQELSQEALKTKKNLLQRLQMVYATSSPTDTLQVNLVLAELKNQVVKWDLKYVEFARRFVRPERELRRLTATHLRKMFPAENLYNSTTTLTVSNLNLRTKRAIEAADLPLLDVGLDSDCYSSVSSGLIITDPNVQFDDDNVCLKEQPTLGQSPTESYPWSDELKRFNQMFLEGDKSDNNHQGFDNNQQRDSSGGKKLSGVDLENSASTLVSAYQATSSTSQSAANLIEDDPSRDLDPSVARRLSLELMKDGPKKKMEQQQIENKKHVQERKKTLKYLQESRMIEKSASNDTLNSSVATSSRSSLPIPIKMLGKEAKPQSQLDKHVAALPILSTTTYKRLAGLLPDPIVGKSKSSPSPVNSQGQQKNSSPYQKLIDQKRANRKSTLLEPSYAMLDDDDSQPTVPQPPAYPIVKPSFYRGSPYTAKPQDHSAIAYRYGFMSGLNSGVSLVERRLGATSITHPVSSAIAAANAAAAAAAAAAATSSTTNTSTNTTSSNQDLSVIRPRSRTMAIVNGPTNVKSFDQPSVSRPRVGGRIPIPISNQFQDKSTSSRPLYSQKHTASHLPVPTHRRQFHQHGRHLSESKINSQTILQALNNEVSITELTRDDDDDFSLSSSSDDEEDNGTVHLLDNSACDENLMTSSFEYDEIDGEDDGLLPFQYKSFSLVGMDEYDESLGREMVPSILELQEFHREHQLQISKSNLPFLSLECGMVAAKKNEGGEHHLSTKSSVATMIGAADLLQQTNGSVIGLEHNNRSSNLDWSTHDNGRNSIMKAITYVLAEKSISNLLPLEYPFSFNEHIFSDSRILVREDEPSSIISYMLGSQFYEEKLQRKQQARMSKATSSELFQQDASKEKLDMDPIEGKSFFSEMFPETDEREKPWKFFFQHEATSFSCKIYFAEQFDMLRKSCGCDDIFISSLARCTTYDPAGGKSGSMFLKTKDERFLIKQISKYEMDAFLGSANKYFMYMFNEVFDKGIPTVLCKIFGLYRIGFYNSVSGKSMKMDILVMENLFYDTSVKKVFDLKGSMRNRYAEKTGKDVEVFLDENLVEIISKTPLYMKVDTKCNLSDSLYNDTQFLLSIDVMDYSLLVGFNEDTNEIYVGIVDFIRTFTWDKKLESWVKESGMLGGGKKDPTIVSPKMYRKRFRSAIDLYFCMIPDFWTLILE